MRILRGLSSRFLPCGCLAGVYETYDGNVVSILDAKSGSCANDAHRNGNIVPDQSDSSHHSLALDARYRRSAQD